LWAFSSSGVESGLKAERTGETQPDIGSGIIGKVSKTLAFQRSGRVIAITRENQQRRETLFAYSMEITRRRYRSVRFGDSRP
jgi:hypothetical protein